MLPARKNLKANAGNIVIPCPAKGGMKAANVCASTETMATARASGRAAVNSETILPPLPVPGSIEYINIPAPSDEDEEEEELGKEDMGEHQQQEQMESNDTTQDSTKRHPKPRPTWTISIVAENLVNSLRVASSNRNPDSHNMYIYNDFYGYGKVEVIENWVTDFAKTWGRYKA
ncbi:hypothetical protein BDZ91DRAFT_92149 [Kalaharituber pfeilii]|nr:hypothetical protein BDZ91DRAFT_92149 [Kalaharituber pfeilii]